MYIVIYTYIYIVYIYIYTIHILYTYIYIRIYICKCSRCSLLLPMSTYDYHDCDCTCSSCGILPWFYNDTLRKCIYEMGSSWLTDVLVIPCNSHPQWLSRFQSPGLGVEPQCWNPGPAVGLHSWVQSYQYHPVSIYQKQIIMTIFIIHLWYPGKIFRKWSM